MSDQQPWPAREDSGWTSGRARRGRDGEVVPWDGRPVEPGAEPTRAEVIVRYDTDGGSGGKPPGGRRHPSLLVLLLSLLVVAIIAIAVLVISRPNKATPVANQASTTASASSASPSATSPSPSGSDAAPAESTTGSPSAPAANSQSSGAPNTIQASGGGAGAEVADLSALSPVQTEGVSGPDNGPEQIGATIYQNSVGFTCENDNPSFIDYNVAGYKFLNAVIGIPSSASNAAGNSMTITFFKDGSSTQLSSPVTVSLDHPQLVHLNLDGSSQLEIACTAISTTTHSTEWMDGALGNATIGPS